MATPRKRPKPKTILAPKEVKGKEADRVRGGLVMDMLSKLIQMKNDMQKGIIANFRV